MVRLLVIADDFTGALDCGVQLAQRGCETRVVVGVPEALGGSEVLVVDTETRHLAPEDAYGVILKLALLARDEKVGCIYKKTDSALRGNIGAELAAVLEGFGESRLLFFPAYPQMGRTVENGTLYIKGTPVAESVFGADPFEPVRASYIPELIAAQSAAPVTSLPPLRERAELEGREGILVFDASREEDHETAGRVLTGAGGIRAAAGCAGFAGLLTDILGLGGTAPAHPPALDPRLLMVCGSVNPITVRQIGCAQRHGFYRVGLTPRQKLERDYWRTEEGLRDMERLRRSLREHALCVIDVNDDPGGKSTDECARERGMAVSDVRVAVAACVGHIVGELVDDPGLGTLFITGGDTLLQCMNTLGVHEMEPVCELDTGIVLSRFTLRGRKRYVISKSGGFGGEDLFVTLAKRVSESKKIINGGSNMTYPVLPGLTYDGQLYENPEMGTVEAVIPPGPHATCHSPATLELPNGDILCCWFAGTYEGSADVHIVCAKLKKDSGKWTEPVDISGDPTRSEQNPSLFYGPDGAVWAMYTAQKDREAGKDNMQFTSQVRVQKSFDGGETWGPYETMFPREGTFCRQAIQILSNGRWIFGNWLCTDSVDGLSGDPTAFQISDDQGKTWRQVDMPKSNGRVHANVVELEPGHLVAFMRDREAAHIYRSESTDNGDTWSVPAPTPLPNNNSSISAIKLQSGRIAIACNPTCTPVPSPGKAAWPGLRCPVAVALSEDGGLTFPLIRWMERGEGFMGDENKTNNKQYEYPHIMQSRDGRIHLTYAAFTRKAVKYVSFTEEDVMGKKRETVGLYNPTAAQSR